MDFADWLNRELNERDWSQNELARRMGKSSGGLSMIVNQQRGITADFCRELARVLHLPETVIFERAGLLSPASNSGELTLRELYEILKELPVEEQRAILAEAQDRYEAARNTGCNAPEPATT